MGESRLDQHRLHLDVVLLGEGAIARGIAIPRLLDELVEQRLVSWIGHRLLEGIVQRLDHGRRQVLGSDQAIGADGDGIDAAFHQGRLVGVFRKSLGRGHRQHADLAVLHERRPLRAIGNELDMAAQQGRHELRAALVGNVGEARARGLFGLEHQQVTGAADAAGAVVQLLGLAPPRVDQVGDGLVGRVRAHDHAEGELREADDVGEVAQRMPVRRLIVRDSAGC